MTRLKSTQFVIRSCIKCQCIHMEFLGARGAVVMREDLSSEQALRLADSICGMLLGVHLSDFVDIPHAEDTIGATEGSA